MNTHALSSMAFGGEPLPTAILAGSPPAVPNPAAMPDRRGAVGLAAGLPVKQKAKIKLDLRGKADAQLAPFCQAIITAMEDNPNFPDPVPPSPIFNGTVENYATKLQRHLLAKAAALQAKNEKDIARALVEKQVNTRADYVQTRSGGDAAIILSAGMPLRATRSPIGDLPPPQNLRIELNGTAGLMILTWNRVPKSLSYVIQWSEAATAERNWISLKTTTDRKLLLTETVLGMTYAFRVATIGGASGQSQWSPEVLRMAA